MDILNSINELPKILRRRSQGQESSEILAKFEKDKLKSYSYAARAISIVCQDIEKNQNFDEVSLESYTDFMVEITKYINNGKYEKFMLQNIKFFVYFLLNKGADKQLKNFFKIFVIDQIFCNDSYRLYFEIVKNGQFYSLQKDVKFKLKYNNDVRVCFNNLQRCMEVPEENTFLSFLSELFDHESSFNTLLRCQDEANRLIFLCFSKLKNFSFCNYKLEEYFLLITKFFLLFNKYEILLESKKFWSLELMKNVVENQVIKKHIYHHYALTLLLYIASLRSKSFSQQNLKEILRKQSKLLENNQNSIWYYDVQWTFVELFSRNSNYILKNIEEENLKFLIEILYKITNLIEHITSYSKQNCYICKNYQCHEIINTFQIMVEIYEHIIQFECDCEKAGFLVQYVLNRIAENYASIVQCKYMEVTFKNKLSYLKKLISKVQTTKMAKTSIDILNTLNSSYFVQNIQDKLLHAKLYLHLHTILDEKLLILQLYAVILNLLSKSNCNVNSYMLSFVKLLTELNMTTVTIKEVLQNCQKNFLDNEYVDESSFNFLIKKQLEIITTFKLFPNDKIESLLEKINDDNVLTQLEFVMVVKNLEQFLTSKKLCEKLEWIRIIKEKSSDDLEKYLILGHIYKYIALKKFEESKNSFLLKIATEEDLTGINISDFNKINLNEECDIIQPALSSLHYFKNIFEIYNEQCSELIHIDAILDDLSYLARHFQFRGYLESATEAWFLVHSFAKHVTKSELHQMRALTFFCKYVHYNILEKYNLDLEVEINFLSEKVLENYRNLENLSPRKQNYVLLYLLNVAHYYGYHNDIKSLKVLVKMVQVKVNGIKERRFKFELVRAHLVSLEMHFRMITLAKLDISPYIYVCHILSELKEVVYITSEDALNMSCFLIELLESIASFLYTIVDTKIIISYLTYVLSFSLQYGITLRVTKLFVIWTKISLQNGDVNNTQLKLLILEKLILETESNNIHIDKYFNEAIGSTKNANDFVNSERSLEQQTIDETRKAVQVISLSENSLIFSDELQSRDFLKYLINHNKTCICNICKIPVYQFFIFEIGFCYMKMNILKNKDKLIINLFLKESLKWISKIKKKFIREMFEETVFYLYLDNIMWCRLNEKYSEALDFCQIASDFLENKKFQNNIIWKVIEHSFALQLNCKAGKTNVKSLVTEKTRHCRSKKV